MNIGGNDPKTMKKSNTIDYTDKNYRTEKHHNLNSTTDRKNQPSKMAARELYSIIEDRSTSKIEKEIVFINQGVMENNHEEIFQ